ncbi:MAG TPA: glycosyltransferase, partial [Mycobacteriales bacterium]|nr:glycosyltransferase [Mycobacteriales bacterium]
MTPLPLGFRLVADRRTRRHDDDRLLVGGHPHRVLRLSDRGAAIARNLWSGSVVATRADGVLARRLIDAGMAHPIPPAATPSITVVIPAYDDNTALERCLEALGNELSVYVVDDGSADAGSMCAVTGRHGASLHRLARNAGPAAARNAGARDLTTDVIAFVDSDANTTPSALRQLATHFADPDIAAIAPRVRPSPSRRRGFLDEFSREMSPLDLGSEPSIVGPDRLVTYVPSTVLLVRRTSFEAIGGFDPSLRFGEDVDLIWRLHAAGFCTRYAPEVRVGHEEPTDWRQWLVRRY